jgi:Glutamate-cysteine ligase.
MYHTLRMLLSYLRRLVDIVCSFVGIKKQERSKSPDLFCCYRYNDVPLIYDKDIYKQLRDADIDHLLAQHIAHLFIRDSVSLFSEKVNQDDEQDTDHFEVYHL